MPANPFKTNEESSFEQGHSLTKPVKAVSAAAAQQAKAFKDDFLAQLYGPSDKSGQDTQDPNAKNPPPAPPPAPAKSKPPMLSGNSNAGDHGKYMARQQYLDKGDAKGADDAMFHLQHYFDETIMTLEDRVKKVRQEQEQKKQERKKQAEQEEQERQEAEAKEKEELPQSGNKDRRNRMGKKATTNIALKMSTQKTETFRGSSG